MEQVLKFCESNDHNWGLTKNAMLQVFGLERLGSSSGLPAYSDE